MGFLGNVLSTPFKAVGDVFKGAWNMTGGTILKGLGTVAKAATQLLTLHPIEAMKTLVGGTFETAGTFLKGAGQTFRGAVGIGGTVGAIGATAVGGPLAGAAVYGGTVGAYTLMGG